MNTDAVNQKESILNTYLAKTLQNVMDYVIDPFMTVKEFAYSNIFMINKMLNLKY